MVTLNNLTKRINRHLSKEGRHGQRLRRIRPPRLDVGDWVVVDIDGDVIVQRHVDVEELARELGVLASHEHLTN